MTRFEIQTLPPSFDGGERTWKTVGGALRGDAAVQGAVAHFTAKGWPVRVRDGGMVIFELEA